MFWGHNYTSWSQIPLPGTVASQVHNPGLALDYKRWYNDAVRDYMEIQLKILRNFIGKEVAVTHNAMGTFLPLDYSYFYENLDFVAWDNYPLWGTTVGDLRAT